MKDDGHTRGSIVLRITEKKPEKGVAETVAYARTTSDNIGTSCAVTVDSSGGIQSVAKVDDTISGLGNTCDTLSQIVSKLEGLVQVVDQVAKVQSLFAYTAPGSLRGIN